MPQKVKISPTYKPKDTAEFKQCLKSRMWRLHNLYTIRDKNAELVRFVPNREQLYLLQHMHTRNVILKVRQLGISTFWLIYMLDACLFYPGVETGCIAHTREDAQELFENKVKLAYENLPREIQRMHKQTSDSARKLAFSNGSSIRIGTSFRSGTPVIVLVSEFGKIASRWPEQAKEIQTGTFNAVPSNGILVVESTAEGNEGDYFEMVQSARRKQQLEEPLTEYDFKFFFFDWVSTPQYKLAPDAVRVSDELTQYFDQKEKELNISIPPSKRSWYAAKSGNRVSQAMKQEYPTDPDEAFEQSIEGAIFYHEMSTLRTSKRITDVSPDTSRMVDTVWDIGYRASTAIIWFQVLPNHEVLIFDYYENQREALKHYAKIIEQKREEHGIIYGRHYGPHDLQKHDYNTGITAFDFARSLGLHFDVIPKARSKWDLIEAARRTIPVSWIDRSRCQQLIKCLDNYRLEWKATVGQYSSKPLDNWAAHGADSFQYLSFVRENYGGSQNAMTQERIRNLYEAYGPPPV